MVECERLRQNGVLWGHNCGEWITQGGFLEHALYMPVRPVSWLGECPCSGACDLPAPAAVPVT